MSTITNSDPLTAEQLASLPDDGQRRELVDGVIKMMSPAGGRHGQVALQIGRILGNHVQLNRLGTVFAAETGFVLSRNPDTVRAPDLAFVRKERMDQLSDINGFIPLAPDLVAEVISPRDRFSDVEEKAWYWVRSGVQVVIIIDPANRAVHICRRAGEIVRLDESAELIIDEVVPGWRLRIAELFD